MFTKTFIKADFSFKPEFEPPPHFHAECKHRWPLPSVTQIMRRPKRDRFYHRRAVLARVDDERLLHVRELSTPSCHVSLPRRTPTAENSTREWSSFQVTEQPKERRSATVGSKWPPGFRSGSAMAERQPGRCDSNKTCGPVAARLWTNPAALFCSKHARETVFVTISQGLQCMGE